MTSISGIMANSTVKEVVVTRGGFPLLPAIGVGVIGTIIGKSDGLIVGAVGRINSYSAAEYAVIAVAPLYSRHPGDQLN